jgi:hypothetical protein
MLLSLSEKHGVSFGCLGNIPLQAMSYFREELHFQFCEAFKGNVLARIESLSHDDIKVLD